MSEQLDPNRGLELRFTQGETVGIVLTPKTVHELTTERDQLRAEADRLRAEAAELRHALDEARQEVRDKAAIMAERDLYLRELEGFWGEKIAEMDKNGLDFGEVIAEMEQDLRAKGMLDSK
jgi:uncharacterized coiled-coil DUF342 family protein